MPGAAVVPPPMGTVTHALWAQEFNSRVIGNRLGDALFRTGHGSDPLVSTLGVPEGSGNTRQHDKRTLCDGQ
jgi:hypothetical protein